MAKPEVIPPGADTDRETPFTSDALAVLNRSEIEQQIEIARKYPRSVDNFRKKLDQYANTNELVALSMFYSLKRRKGDGTESVIAGPSVRFAETLLPCWGNSRAGTRILGDQGSVATAQGVFFDCESNVGISVESQRSITGKHGRFSQDMIVLTGNAASSFAYRNAIIRGIPRSLWLDIADKCKLTAVGKAESFAGQVNKAVEEFSKQGVTQVALLNTLGAASIRDITADHILAMRTMFREIRDGDKTIEDVFGSPIDAEIDAAMVQLGWNASKQNLSRSSFTGRREDHLGFLRGELAKMGKSTPDSKPAPTEQKPAEQASQPTGEAASAPAQQELIPAGEPKVAEEKPSEAKPQAKKPVAEDW